MPVKSEYIFTSFYYFFSLNKWICLFLVQLFIQIIILLLLMSLTNRFVVHAEHLECHNGHCLLGQLFTRLPTG